MRISLLTLCLSLFSAECLADVVTYNFQGTIREVHDSASPVNDVGGIKGGDAFTSVFRYDASKFSGDFDPTPGHGLFLQAGAFEFEFTVNGLRFALDPTEQNLLETWNSSGIVNFQDLLNFTSQPMDEASRRRLSLPPGWSIPTQSDAALIATFGDSKGKAITSDLPPNIFDPSKFDGAVFNLFFNNVSFPGGSDSQVRIFGSIGLAPAAVPEPSSFALLSLVGVGAVMTGRRRRRTCSSS
jgi:hypothetical protein